MQKDKKYTFESRIRFSEIDHTKKITLPGIINYFQDCTTFHSESLGLGIDYFGEHQRAWVLSYWQVIVERYPHFGEEIKISTWATKFKGMVGDRNFCMTDKDGRMVAYANSMWAYMDMAKGRPARPEPEEIEPYGSGEALEMAYEPRKIVIPEAMKELAHIPVKRYHIDTNEHVNNCQYVQMAMEALDEERQIRQIRVEYKRSAVYQDIIVPKVGNRDDRTVVELSNENGEIYAVAEFAWA